MNWYLGCWKKYVEFSGRARRREYWLFVLFNIIFGIVVGALDAVLGTGMMLYHAYSLAVLLPGLAVTVRRLHDTDRSGWWYLIGLVPIIGWIVLLVFFCSDSTPGGNRFGPNPKGAAAAA